jgi:threonyl-tRNA synthetase
MTAASSAAKGEADAPAEAQPKPADAAEAGDKAKQPSNVVPTGYARPVMIHRAIVGSFERFIANITEHFAGKWPFWLSPRQILLVPVMSHAEDYVREVEKILKQRGFYADSDLSGNTMNKKIRTGQLLQYNYIFGMSSYQVNELI